MKNLYKMVVFLTKNRTHDQRLQSGSNIRKIATFVPWTLLTKTFLSICGENR